MAAPFVTGALGYLYSIQPSTRLAAPTARRCWPARRPRRWAGPTTSTCTARLVKLNLLKTRRRPQRLEPRRRSAGVPQRLRHAPIGLDTTGSTLADGRDTDLGPMRAQPDGKIDMRDFRAMRDAWLKTCHDGSAGTPGRGGPRRARRRSASTAPPTTEEGRQRRPLRDHADVATARPPSRTYSRFDANGDGHLSMYDKAPVNDRQPGPPGDDDAAAHRPRRAADLLRDEHDEHRGVGQGRAAQPARVRRPRRAPRRVLGGRGDLGPGDHDGRRASRPARRARSPSRPAAPAAGSSPCPSPPTARPSSSWPRPPARTARRSIGTPVVVGMAAGDDAVATPCVARLELELGAPALLPGKETELRPQIHDCNLRPRRARSWRDRPVTFAVGATGDRRCR